jgi:hypothetical protein
MLNFIHVELTKPKQLHKNVFSSRIKGQILIRVKGHEKQPYKNKGRPTGLVKAFYYCVSGIVAFITNDIEPQFFPFLLLCPNHLRLEFTKNLRPKHA